MFLEVKDDTFEKHQNRQNSNNSSVFYMHGGMLKVYILIYNTYVVASIAYVSKQSLANH